MDITFVVEDWGGPIGLSYALNHPERCRNLVITNTWLWSVRHDWHFQAFSKFVGGAIGRFLIKKRNFFARDLLKAGFADKKKLTEKIHNHYLMPLAKPCARKGNWTFPKQIVAASEWLASLWQRRHILQQHNVLLAWGMKDLAFRPKELNKWIEALPHARVVPFPEAGHFVAEEKPEELGREIEALLAGAFYS
jgi:haloalkane dehalogenase